MIRLELILKILLKRIKLLQIIVLLIPYVSLFTITLLSEKIRVLFTELPEMVYYMIVICSVAFAVFIVIITVMRIISTQKYLKLYRYLGYPSGFLLLYNVLDLIIINVISVISGLFLSEILANVLWAYIERIVS